MKINNLLILSFFLLIIACQKEKTAQKERSIALNANDVIKENPAFAHLGKLKLSEYSFFEGNLSDLIPTENVFPYALNTPLFSDYAFKKRFIYLPNGEKMTYHPTETFNFPEGAIIIKNFYYPKDFRKEEGEKRIIETRLLIKEATAWKALSYIWNQAQTDAFLEVSGGETTVSWTHYDGSLKQINYLIPNMTQCKSCHLNGKEIVPIGPKARHLNRDYTFHDGHFNQLDYFEKKKIVSELVSEKERPKNVVWNDENEPLDARAIAYLDINCGHCHQPKGPAKTSGLNLTVFAKTPMEKGILKAPIAAGKGAGNLHYDIVPQKPNHSILLYRMKSTDPGVMMPEIGRSIAHQEGIQLIHDWILNMKTEDSL